jgi:hypothetical protein
MATPSPADTPPPSGAQPPAKVEHRDARADFIPESVILGGAHGGETSISRLGLGDTAGSLRLEGVEPTYGSHRPRALPGSATGDVLVIVGLAVAGLGFLVWRHFQREAQENFAGQDHNRD